MFQRQSGLRAQMLVGVPQQQLGDQGLPQPQFGDQGLQLGNHGLQPLNTGDAKTDTENKADHIDWYCLSNKMSQAQWVLVSI